MSYSKSNPKAKATNSHDFASGRAAWEVSVFDEADHFFALILGPGQGQRERHEFSTFREASGFADKQAYCCVYAVTASGRACVLDRALWPQWQEREDGQE